MKIGRFGLAAVMGLVGLAGCEEPKTEAPGSGREIKGQAPKETRSPKQEEAGGAAGGGAFTANPTGDIPPSEVPKDYPRPEGVTPRPENAPKPAEGGSDLAKPADAGTEAPKTGDAPK